MLDYSAFGCSTWETAEQSTTGQHREARDAEQAAPPVFGARPLGFILHWRIASGGGGGPSGWHRPVTPLTTKQRHGFWQPTDLLHELPQAGSCAARAPSWRADRAPADKTAAIVAVNINFLTMAEILSCSLLGGRRRGAFRLTNAVCRIVKSEAKTGALADVRRGTRTSASENCVGSGSQLTRGHRTCGQNCRESCHEQELLDHAISFQHQVTIPTRFGHGQPDNYTAVACRLVIFFLILG